MGAASPPDPVGVTRPRRETERRTDPMRTSHRTRPATGNSRVTRYPSADFTASASRPATDRACSMSAASTMTRTSGSVPD